MKAAASRRVPVRRATKPNSRQPAAPPRFISIAPEMPPLTLRPSSVSTFGVQLRKK